MTPAFRRVALVVGLLLPVAASAQATVDAYAGGGTGEGFLEIADVDGRDLNLIVSDAGRHRLRIRQNGAWRTIGGVVDTPGFSGDGGPALAAKMNRPTVIRDRWPDVIFYDAGNHRVRRIAGDGRITTIAGNGVAGFSGDGGPATQAAIGEVTAITYDDAGTIWLSFADQHRIRRIALDGTISTVVGTGTAGYSGDGGPAAAAMLSAPDDVEYRDGNLYIADTGNGLVRVVGADGNIVTSAGDPAGGSLAENVRVELADLVAPVDVSFDDAGVMTIADAGRGLVREVRDGRINTVLGNGSLDFDVDVYVPGLSVGLGTITSLSAGRPNVSGIGLHVVASGALVEVSGNDDAIIGLTEPGLGVGDGIIDGGVHPERARYDAPTLVTRGDEDFSPTLHVSYVVAAHRLRVIREHDRHSDTLVGDGVYEAAPADGYGRATRLGDITGIDVVYDHFFKDDHVYLAEASSHRIREYVDDHGNTVGTYAGNGTPGNGGDGGPCLQASFLAPAGLAADAGGRIYVSSGNRIRRLAAFCESVSTFAGTDEAGFAGDRGEPASVRLSSPGALAIDAQGSLYVADRGNRRLRMLSLDGSIDTIAGNGSATLSGLNGPARQAGIGTIRGLVIDKQGRPVFTTDATHQVLYVDIDGDLRVYAGQGPAGYSGDGGAALAARFSSPHGLAQMWDGRMLVADRGNDRLRVLSELAADDRVAPGAMAAPAPTAGNTQVALVLTPPIDDGGDAIQRYEVRTTPTAGVDGGAGTTALARIVTGLANGQAYTFAVRAVNQVGPGPWSPESAPATPSAAQLPRLAIADVVLHEQDIGENGEQDLAFVKVTLDRPAQQRITFRVQVQHVDTSEFEVWGPGEVAIAVGASETQILVATEADDAFEGEERFVLHAADLVGALPAADADGDGVVYDDDAPGPLAVVDDRFSVRINTPTIIDVMANDYYATALSAPLRVLAPPARGTLLLQDQGTPSPLDDRFLYTPAADAVGDERFRYEACYLPRLCREAEVQLHVRPSPWVAAGSAGESGGFVDVALDGLPALPSARYAATAFVAPQVGATHALVRPHGDDIDAYHPWTAPAASRGVDTFELPAPAAARIVRIAARRAGGEAAVYLGIDDDGDGQPDAGERLCTASPGPEAWCEAEIAQAAGQVVRLWTMLHATRSDSAGVGTSTAVELYAVPLDAPGTAAVVATGPGRPPDGAFPLRIVWRDMAADDRRVGFVRITSGATDAGLVPVLVDRDGGETGARMLVDGREILLRTRTSDARLFIDVPPGATRLTLVSRRANRNVDFRLVREGARAPAQSGIGPGAGETVATAASASGNESLVLEAPVLAPGRWYVVATNVDAAAGPAEYFLRATLEFAGVAATVPAGSYYNPGRPGHGLFLYPAGGDWAGLWYTYLQDRTPTWYWLQGAQPGADGIWTGKVYRAAWNGSGNQLVEVGEAVVTPVAGATPGFRFGYVLDGETGAETMTALGSGCPLSGGAPVDISTHWFNPARAGTGYSVQTWANYEFLAAFVYDGHGVPRYVSGELPRFGGAVADFALLQTAGACPLCTHSAPTYRDIGVFGRELNGDGTLRMRLDGIYEAGVPGAWSVDEAVQTLGGAGTTQGCD